MWTVQFTQRVDGEVAWSRDAQVRAAMPEIAHALKVVASIENARADGLGAYVVDGRMIDEPFIRRAQSIVAQARQLGLLNAASFQQP